ncbi:vWA domain-containing protein [Floccifex sp.]|uniref:vWA domain-containing protein n=1 Tax=Floccifex sp. TaxID=2815810 RepID=UPI002A7526A3|nr:vWA domain-containing protein [Floccifex sp.]MDD7280606.1 VWA domain-containing protein [Erysipelotrichaceae bacterium]MDY2958868.1 vWA domain-containing protein [Floccifex sp.]
MLTEIVFVLDRSGSMHGLEKETINGFNSLIDKQKKEDGQAIVSTVLFDNEIELLHDRELIEKINPITEKEYYVRGCTALLDAIGFSIHHVESSKADKVLVIITTDGMENASKEYSYNKIHRLIDKQKEKGWDFLFLGANIDAIQEANRFGIDADFATGYRSDAVGTSLNYDVLNDAIGNVRKNKKLDKSWKERIEKRGK